MLDLYIFEINDKNIDIDLSKSILDHCKQYKNKDAYKQSIFAWSKLKYILSKYYNININKESLLFNKDNKPYFKNNTIFFNISHTSNLIALAISDKEVSCDIQDLIPLNRLDLLGDRLVEKEKWESLKSLKDKQNYLTKIWTQKECYIKLNGFDINIVRNRMNDKCLFNTFSIIHSNQHYYCSVMNKNNEKVNKIMENEQIVTQPVLEAVPADKKQKVEKPKQPRGNRLAKPGWITGIISLATCVTGLIGLITGIVAIVFSAIARKQKAIDEKWLNRANKSLKFGIIGTAISGVMIIVWSIVISYIMWKYIIW